MAPRTRTAARRPPQMKTREFLSELVELVRIQLPSGLRDMRVVGPLFTLVKFHYGDPVVHYEVWIQRRAGLVEVGLHFEGTAERNAKYLAAMSRRAKEITKALGPSVELEQWTASWTRVHEHMPLEALDADTLVAVAHRLAGMIRVLEPMVRGAAV